jgi:hypothetical protein
MVAYLTPRRYKSMGLGVDLSGKSDAELESNLSIASEMVNRYCAAPYGHDFRGGTATDEKHRWNPGNVYKVGTTRIYPYHKPVKEVSGLVIDVTNTQRITLDAEDLYVNEREGWVEPVALAMTTAGVFGFSILPNVGLRIPIGRISYTYGWSFTVTDEELTTYSGNVLSGQNQFWVTEEEVILKQNGVTLAKGPDYSVDYTEGQVTVSNYVSADTYTASYTFPLPPAIGYATALIANDLQGQANFASQGMLGLSRLTVEEITIQQSAKFNFYATPVNGAAATLLDPFVYRRIG